MFFHFVRFVSFVVRSNEPGIRSEILHQSRRVINVIGWRVRKATRHTRLKEKCSMAPDKEALLAEERKLRRLGRAMDLAAALLWRVDLTLDEARDVVNHAKRTALELFPDKEETFDLIYGSRFRRILVEKYHLQ